MQQEENIIEETDFATDFFRASQKLLLDNQLVKLIVLHIIEKSRFIRKLSFVSLNTNLWITCSLEPRKIWTRKDH